MIKAVVFDFGNVISEPQDTGCYGRMANLSGLPADYFSRAFWKYREDYDGGKIHGRQMYRAVLADAGVRGEEAALDGLAERLLNEDLDSWFHVSADVTHWGLSLKQSGYALGILSNMPFDFLDRYEDKIEMFGKADVAVFSCRVGQIKPGAEIYQTLISRLGVRPGEIAFFDDLEPNVAGARKAGINAFLWTGLARAQADFSALVASN